VTQIDSGAPLTTNEQANPITSPNTMDREQSSSDSSGTAATEVADNGNYSYQGLHVINPMATSPTKYHHNINGFSYTNGKPWPSKLPPASKKHSGQKLSANLHSADETEV